MKKLLLILLCLPMIGFGQKAEAGKFYIAMGSGQDMSFGSSWTTDVKIEGVDSVTSTSTYYNENYKVKLNNFNIYGQFGYFIVDGLVTGLGVSYNSRTNKTETVDDFDGDGYDDEYTYKSTGSSLSLTPFLKYYIDVGNNALFVKTSYQFSLLNSSKSETEYVYTSSTSFSGSSKSNSKNSRLSFGTGMAFFLTESIALEPSINYDIIMRTLEYERPVGYNPITNTNTYDLQERKETLNSISIGIAASMFF
jgi:hypothetical protein